MSFGKVNPAPVWVPCTPSDSTDIARDCAAVMVASGGVIAYLDAFGRSRTITVPAGVWPVQNVKRIKSTNTTATGISIAYHTDQG